MKYVPIALLIMGLVSSSAAAQSERVDAPAASEQPAEDNGEEIIVEGEVPKEKRRVCEMQTTTGSIMPKRVCRTVAQIEEDERTARESMEIMQRDHDTRSFVELSRTQGR